MSLYDYQVSRVIDALDPTYEALIMAALRKADSLNALAIRTQWPAIAQECQARYDAPGGILSPDPEARR